MSEGAGDSGAGFGYPGEPPGVLPGAPPVVATAPVEYWTALADRSAAEARRRGRLRVLLGVLGVLVVLGGAGAAVLLARSPTAPRAAAVVAAGASTASADPTTPLWDAATDTAPLSAAGLFPEPTVTVAGATWTRAAEVATEPCWKATTGGLGNLLAAQDCRQVIRASYATGDSVVTLGVAVFDHRSQADAAFAGFQGQLQGLAAPGAVSFCTGPGCAGTHGTLGRYGYLTVEGTVKPGGAAQDATATAAAPAFDAYLRTRLLQRAAAAG
ncbi:hypothetical protein ACIGXM_07030 [Kitasatospora sp. NPDC052896]|uniref:hypothetical protein n=1 Tax=Kitasatospora sp. NPDC052896 TaxID=3364061 RepID=UPI0037C5F60A